jgi:hypothetical protein
MLVAALEFDLEHGKADDDAAHVLLGAHAWPAVLASPQPEYVGAATRVFRCVLGSDAALARGGWRRVDLGTPTALGDHEMDGRTGEFVALWPRPAWCAPPSEDATRAPLCRLLRRSDFADVGVLAAASAHADAQEPVVGRSQRSSGARSSLKSREQSARQLVRVRRPARRSSLPPRPRQARGGAAGRSMGAWTAASAAA